MQLVQIEDKPKIKNVYLQQATHNVKISHCSKLYIKIILFKNFLI
jgi:hypothetical protein